MHATAWTKYRLACIHRERQHNSQLKLAGVKYTLIGVGWSIGKAYPMEISAKCTLSMTIVGEGHVTDPSNQERQTMYMQVKS